MDEFFYFLLFYNALDLNNQKILCLPSIYEFESSWGLLRLPVIQANGRLTFEDDLRSGGLLYFTTLHRGVSFFSGGFISAIVVNPPERKLAKRTSLQCVPESALCLPTV